MRRSEPGAPFPLGAKQPEMVLTEVGDFDGDEGMKIVLVGQDLMFLGSFSGTQVMVGIAITDVLDAIQTFGRKHES